MKLILLFFITTFYFINTSCSQEINEYNKEVGINAMILFDHSVVGISGAYRQNKLLEYELDFKSYNVFENRKSSYSWFLHAGPNFYLGKGVRKMNFIPSIHGLYEHSRNSHIIGILPGFIVKYNASKRFALKFNLRIGPVFQYTDRPCNDFLISNSIECSDNHRVRERETFGSMDIGIYYRFK